MAAVRGRIVNDTFDRLFGLVGQATRDRLPLLVQGILVWRGLLHVNDEHLLCHRDKVLYVSLQSVEKIFEIVAGRLACNGASITVAIVDLVL